MDMKYCANCHTQQKANRTTCFKCGKPLPPEIVKDNSSAVGIGVVVVIIVLFTLVIALSDSDGGSRNSGAYLNRDISTWTDSEKRDFDAFWKWNNSNP